MRTVGELRVRESGLLLSLSRTKPGWEHHVAREIESALNTRDGPNRQTQSRRPTIEYYQAFGDFGVATLVDSLNFSESQDIQMSEKHLNLKHHALILWQRRTAEGGWEPLARHVATGVDGRILRDEPLAVRLPQREPVLYVVNLKIRAEVLLAEQTECPFSGAALLQHAAALVFDTFVSCLRRVADLDAKFVVATSLGGCEIFLLVFPNLLRELHEIVLADLSTLAVSSTHQKDHPIFYEASAFLAVNDCVIVSETVATEQGEVCPIARGVAEEYSVPDGALARIMVSPIVRVKCKPAACERMRGRLKRMLAEWPSDRGETDIAPEVWWSLGKSSLFFEFVGLADRRRAWISLLDYIRYYLIDVYHAQAEQAIIVHAESTFLFEAEVTVPTREYEPLRTIIQPKDIREAVETLARQLSEPGSGSGAAVQSTGGSQVKFLRTVSNSFSNLAGNQEANLYFRDLYVFTLCFLRGLAELCQGEPGVAERVELLREAAQAEAGEGAEAPELVQRRLAQYEQRQLEVLGTPLGAKLRAAELLDKIASHLDIAFRQRALHPISVAESLVPDQILGNIQLQLVLMGINGLANRFLRDLGGETPCLVVVSRVFEFCADKNIGLISVTRQTLVHPPYFLCILHEVLHIFVLQTVSWRYLEEEILPEYEAQLDTQHPFFPVQGAILEHADELVVEYLWYRFVFQPVELDSGGWRTFLTYYLLVAHKHVPHAGRAQERELALVHIRLLVIFACRRLADSGVVEIPPADMLSRAMYESFDDYLEEVRSIESALALQVRFDSHEVEALLGSALIHELHSECLSCARTIETACRDVDMATDHRSLVADLDRLQRGELAQEIELGPVALTTLSVLSTLPDLAAACRGEITEERRQALFRQHVALGLSLWHLSCFEDPAELFEVGAVP
ncbi:hypothetical protein ACFL59_09770 [Planctomycetota bacterium]